MRAEQSTALQKYAYLASLVNRVLSAMHARLVDLVDTDGEVETPEWLAEFDLNEREYRTLLRFREDLLEQTVILATGATTAGLPPEQIEDAMENVLEIAEENEIPLPPPPDTPVPSERNQFEWIYERWVRAD